MEKFKCPSGEMGEPTIADIRTCCITRCGYERLLKCLEETENNEKKSDKVVLEPFIIGKWLLEGGKRCEG